MANENDTLKTFTPSVDEGLFDVSPQLTLDALSGILNPFSRQNTFRTPAREEDIRKELKSSHIPEFTDFLLKGGTRGVGTDDLDKTYAKTDNPLIKQAILRGDDFVTGNIIRNNFYGLDLDDRNLISQAYVINARFNPFSSLGKTKKGEEVPKNIIAEFNKLKKGKKDFDAGNITEEQYETIKGKSYRNLTENISKEASMSLFKDPRSMESIPFNDPYAGKPKSRKAAIEAGIGPFEQGFSGLRAYDLSPLEELQLKSKYGFSPEVPSYLGPRTGTNYVPTKNQERFRVIPQRSKEGYEGFEPERRIDRLEDFVSMEDSNMLSGPEGVYYNPETKQFLRGETTYGEPPVLQGYKYDPRLIELMQMQRSPAFAEQFKNNGGLTQLAKGGTMDIQQQTKNVAAQGRYGDSMLLHVNPAEVKGLASAMPITVNPQTGQPEAFLPFLAPLLGSWAGSALLGAGTAAGLSTAAAAGIGAGLAQTAVTGDIKEGLKAGLMAGFGSKILGEAGAEQTGALEGAEATKQISSAHTQNLLKDPKLTQPGELLAGQIGPPPPVLNELGNVELSNLMADAQNRIGERALGASSKFLEGNPSNIDSLRTAFADPTGGYNVGQGLSNIGSAAMNDPLALAALGTTGTMYGMDMMQADYEEQMRRIEEERLERKRQNELMNPEPILFSAEGGITGYDLGGMVRSKFGDLPDNIGGELPQIYAPARQPYQINPDFMPGFSPETMYFNPATISAPASGLQAGAPSIGVDTYEGSKGGYGGRQAYIAPQVSIDPYAAYTGEAPEGLKFGKQPRPVFVGPELPDQGLVNPGIPDFDGPVGLGGRIGIPNIGNLDMQSIIDSLDQYNIPEREIGLGEFMNQQITPYLDNTMNIAPTLEVAPKLTDMSEDDLQPFIDARNEAGGTDNMSRSVENFLLRSTTRLLENAGMIPPYEDSANKYPINTTKSADVVQPRTLGKQLLPGTDNGIDISQYLGGDNREDTLKGLQGIFGPQVEAGKPEALIDRNNLIEYMKNQGLEPDFASGGDTGLFSDPVLLPPTMPMTAPVAPFGVNPMPVDIMPIPASSNPNIEPYTLGFVSPPDPVIAPPLSPIPVPTEAGALASDLTPAPVLTPVIAPASNYVGGFNPASTPDIPVELSSVIKQNLEDLKESEPDFAGGGKTLSKMGYQEGGMTDMMSDPLTQEVARFILGESDNEEALNMFLTKYGNEAFMELREAVLQSIVPGAQTEGLIAGDGEGGMDDDLRGMIGNKEKIAVSQDEFIVPADVVSMLGDGSSNAGSQELYDMMDRVRQTKTGTTKQAPRLANAGGLLPA